MAFSDDLIRAVVNTGRFTDARAEKYLGDVLIKRRDKIGRAYLAGINPVVNPRLDASGSLAFENAAIVRQRVVAVGCIPRQLVELRQHDRRDTAARRDAQRDDHHDRAYGLAVRRR